MTPIADDYAAIRSRMAEIEAGERANDPVCLLCLGMGWFPAHRGALPWKDPAPISGWDVCEACGNPEGKACP